MNYRQLALTVFLLLALSLTISAQGLPTTAPETVGLSSQGLERATEQLVKHVSNGDIAGVVAAVIRQGKVAYFESFGHIDLDARKPMPTDALFRLYSMTRPITSKITSSNGSALLCSTKPISTKR